jgi:S-adenosylmethionine hydrolase
MGKDGARPLMVFQTDFTYKEGAVCAMYGAVKSVGRDIEIIDGTHELPQYDIWSASYRLWQSMEFWPADTVFVSVVDPGVGTGRRACACRTEGGWHIVTPDNGSLTHVAEHIGIAEVREIDEGVNRLPSTRGTSVFHGRDLFGYCGARLAAGVISFEQVGPAYDAGDIVKLPIAAPTAEGGKVRGIFEIDDPNFGNLWTNIPLRMFEGAGFHYGDTLHMRVKRGGETVLERDVPFERSFGFARPGDIVLYTNELMNIGAAVVQGSLAGLHGLGYGNDCEVEFMRAGA